jgi:predicted nucleic acid-binding protein
VTCTIVRGEILFGIARLAEGKRRDELEIKTGLLLGSILCEPVPVKASDYCATTKLARQRSGLALDENEFWIAATELSLGAILVSRDRDFNGISGLQVLTLA